MIPDYTYTNKTVTKPELEEIGKYIVNNGVKRMLEFGSGISSHYFGTLTDVVSLEDDPNWVEKTEALKEKHGPSDYKVLLWSGKDDIPREAENRWDLVFIDGPIETAMFSYGRTGAFMAARRMVDNGCPAVWVHDAWERHCLDLAVRHLAPVMLLKAYPGWIRPNKYFKNASMLLWERANG